MKNQAHISESSSEDRDRQHALPITPPEASPQQAKETEQESAQIKAAFLSGLSHDLKTPLNAILGFSELGQQHTEDPILASYFENIASSGRVLLGMITDLLDMASAKEGKYVPSVEKVDIAVCMKEAIRGLPASLVNPAVNLTLDNLGMDIRFVEVDKTVLTRVVRRLVSNGMRYTKDGYVAVTYWLDEASVDATSMLHIRVKDTGPGIPLEKTVRIFEVFEPSTQKAHRGPGLGLPLAKALLDAVGGQIRVEPSSEGGTSMLVNLPVTILDQLAEPSDGTLSDSESTAPPLDTVAGKTILLVDDSPTNLMLYESMLFGSGLQIMTASNGAEALELIEEKCPDAILMDLQMPIMNGFEAARRIREREAWREIPVFALSGLSSTIENPGAHLFDGFLEKPVEVDTLIRTIVGILGGPRVETVQEHLAPPPSASGSLNDRSQAPSESEMVHSLSERLSAALSSLPSSERDNVTRRLQNMIERTDVLRHQQSVTLIEELGTEMAELAESIHCDTLAMWGRSVTRFAATFNLIEMNRYLDHIEELKPLVSNA